jgi:peptidoglycan-associated lipoprotein
MRRLAVLVLATLTAAALPGCGPKRPPNLSGATPRGGIDSSGTADTRDDTSRTGVDSGPDTRPLDASGLSGEEIPSTMDATTEGGPLDDIYFDFDQYDLTDAAKATLAQHAQWLQARPGVKVMVEGHCDERGTVDYNLALGDKRARATRDHLVSLGVGEGRVSAISLGKERPKDPGHDEQAWAKNRRAHFALSR